MELANNGNETGTIMSSIKDRISHVRKFLGFTNQKGMADFIGFTTPSNVKKYESGALEVPLTYVQKICFRYPQLLNYLVGTGDLPKELLSEEPQSFPFNKEFKSLNNEDYDTWISGIDIGYRIRIWSLREKISYKKIAGLTGVSNKTISGYINKRVAPKFSVIEAICKHSPLYAPFIIGVFDYIPQLEHPETFSRRLRKVRQRLNLDAQSFSDSIEITEKSLYKVEAGIENLPIRSLQIFCRRNHDFCNYLLNRIQNLPSGKEEAVSEKMIEKIYAIMEAEKMDEMAFLEKTKLSVGSLEKLSNSVDLISVQKICSAFSEYTLYLMHEKMPFTATDDQITPQEKMLRDSFIDQKGA